MLNKNNKENLKRKKDPEFFLKMMHRKIRNRCNCNKGSTSKYYYGKFYCSEKEFINKFKNDKTFLLLYKNWLDSNYEYKLIPSTDRIDKTKDYSLDNIQIVTHSKNASQDKEKLPILMFDLAGNFICEWESKWAAHKALNIPNGNICKVCYGKRKSAGGYVFKFKS